MKIVQILPELNEGGVERGTMELSRELVKRGFESVVISSGGKLAAQIKHDGGLHVTLDVCSKNPLSAPWRIFKLYQTLKKLSPDILHVRSRVPAWMSFFANKWLNLPVISTVHGFNSVGFYSSIMTKADHVICVSTSIKTFIQKHYKTPEEKITVIPRGIDLVTFNPQNIDHEFIEDFKRQHHLHTKWIITTVGRITQLKDLETFIKAIALLKENYPHVIGLIAGGVREDKQEYFTSLQNLAQELHVKDNIIFTGSISKIAEIYSLSDVVVSCSKKPESFGRSVAEAIAMNTPVVATGHGGVLDIIKENENGYFVKVGDDRDLVQKILRVKDKKFDGFAYISHSFSLEHMIATNIQVYKGL